MPTSCQSSAFTGHSASCGPVLLDWSTDCFSHWAVRQHSSHKIFFALKKYVLPEYRQLHMDLRLHPFSACGCTLKGYRNLGWGEGREDKNSSFPNVHPCLCGHPLTLTVMDTQRSLAWKSSLERLPTHKRTWALSKSVQPAWTSTSFSRCLRMELNHQMLASCTIQ